MGSGGLFLEQGGHSPCHPHMHACLPPCAHPRCPDRLHTCRLSTRSTPVLRLRTIKDLIATPEDKLRCRHGTSAFVRPSNAVYLCENRKNTTSLAYHVELFNAYLSNPSPHSEQAQLYVSTRTQRMHEAEINQRRN